MRVVAPAPVNVGNPSDATMAVYAMFVNRGAATDTLVGVESHVARTAGVHATVARNGMSTMEPAPATPVPPGTVETMKPGATHIMLEGLTRLPLAGDSIPVTFVFKRSGKVATHARVIRYEELEQFFRR